MFKQSKANGRLGDFIEQVSVRNKNGLYSNVLSVSNKQGFVKQSEQFEDRTVASEDTSNYKIVKRNNFAYNPARINVGSIARLTKFDVGIVSPMYVCFRTKASIIPEYMEAFFTSQQFFYEMMKRLEGSVRLCLSYEGLCNIPVYIPDMNKQIAMGQNISLILSKIGLEIEYLGRLHQQKQYLLRKMFI
jgi:type I restriction enzyme, S subunit